MLNGKNVQLWFVIVLSVCVSAQAFTIFSLRNASTQQPTHRFFDKSVIDLQSQLTIGDPLAPHKVILYTAPFCSPCDALLERALTLSWQDQDQVQLIVKYTISERDQVGPSSAVLAAYQQGAHREMMQFLHQNPTASHEDIMTFVADLNLDFERFEKELSSPLVAQHLARNRAEGAYFELEQVPFMIIGQNGFSSPTPEEFETKIHQLMNAPAN